MNDYRIIRVMIKYNYAEIQYLGLAYNLAASLWGQGVAYHHVEGISLER